MGNRELAIFDDDLDGARRTQAVQGNALERIAQATVGLSQVAPRLSELAAGRQEESERQAARAKDVSLLARQMTSTLGQTVGVLRTASTEIADLTQAIRRIADQTSLIAINTGVAAARAGVEGRVFTVLAQEIRALSQNTAAAARDVEGKISKLQESAERTARVVGLEGTGSRKSTQDGPGLQWLLERMVEAEESASRQAGEARDLTTLGLRLRELSEQMIQAVGTFRLDAHRRAEALLDDLRHDPDLCSGDAARQERVLRAAVAGCPYVELAYATDMEGIQVTENIAREAFSATYGDSGAGKDWSERPWFVGARRTRDVFSSDIYRSAATDEFCLTVSATFGYQGRTPMGVVAMDVSFSQLLG